MASRWMTGREGRAVLEEAGISAWQARRALECGLAGTPVRTRAALLYDGDVVASLTRRRRVHEREVEARAPEGFVVSRRALRVDVPHEELVEELSVIPRGTTSWAQLGIQLRCRRAPLPFLATVAGFVVLGADLQGVERSRVVLGPPGEWFEDLAETRYLSGTGRSWTFQEARDWGMPPPRIYSRTTA